MADEIRYSNFLSVFVKGTLFSLCSLAFGIQFYLEIVRYMEANTSVGFR